MVPQTHADGQKSETEARVLEVLTHHISVITARSVLRGSAARAGVGLHSLRPGERLALVGQIMQAAKLFVDTTEEREVLLSELRAALNIAAAGTPPRDEIVIRVEQEADVVIARAASRDFCEALGFSPTLHIKVATAISELARNIVQYAGHGEVTIKWLKTGRTGIEIRAVDHGPGIANVDAVLSGTYRSKSGMGMGLRGTKRLMDEFELASEPGKGTTVTLRKYS
jgi:serine/threonine-protein kinase RsbT